MGQIGTIEDETIFNEWSLIFLQIFVCAIQNGLRTCCDNKCTRILGCLISVSLSVYTGIHTWVNLDRIFDKDGYSKYFEMIFEFLQAIPSAGQIGEILS